MATNPRESWRTAGAARGKEVEGERGHQGGTSSFGALALQWRSYTLVVKLIKWCTRGGQFSCVLVLSLDLKRKTTTKSLGRGRKVLTGDGTRRSTLPPRDNVSVPGLPLAPSAKLSPGRRALKPRNQQPAVRTPGEHGANVTDTMGGSSAPQHRMERGSKDGRLRGRRKLGRGRRGCQRGVTSRMSGSEPGGCEGALKVSYGL